MLEIRPADPANQAQIVELWHQGWHEAHASLVPPEVLPFRTKDHFSMWLREAQDMFYTATEKSELLGFVSIKGSEIVKLYVGAHARGTGAAHALLSFAERHLRDDGVSEAQLLCTAGNSRAERFYEREGWRLSGSFKAALWMPGNVDRTVLIPTHRFQKNLVPTA